MGTRGLLLLLLLAAATALQPPSSQEVGYAFEYGVRDESSGTLYAHTEFRHGIVTTGQYTVHLPDGRIQTVKYTADHNGYRATVSYEGLAHHPDKIITTPSKPTNYPPTLAGRPIPVVGRTVLNRPSTISQATSVSQTRHSHSGHGYKTSTSGNSGLLTPVSSEVAPPVPSKIQRVPVGADFPQNLDGFRTTTSALRGNFQKGSQYSGAPILPHLLVHSNILASQEHDLNSYLPSRQNINNTGSFEGYYAPLVPSGRYHATSGESDRHSSFSVSLHKHPDISSQAGRYASGSFHSNQYPNVSKTRTNVPIVSFTNNGIPLVPSRTEGHSVVPVVPENLSFALHNPNIPAAPPGNIKILPHTASKVVVPTVPFPQDSSRHTQLHSFPQHSHRISTHSSLPSSVSPEKHSSIEHSHDRQQVPIRTTFRMPHKLQSGEQDFKQLPQPFNFNQQNSFSSSKTQNFNEFYSLPSSPQTRPRKFPPNTFIPSAIDPLGPPDTAIPTGHGSISHQESGFPLGENQLEQQISPHFHGNGLSGSSKFSSSDFKKQPSNSFSSGHSEYQHGTPSVFIQLSSVSDQKQPLKPNNTPRLFGASFENSNQNDLNYNQGGQSISVPTSLQSQDANSVFIAHGLHNQGASQNYSDGESGESSRPTPRPFIISNEQPFLPSPETKYSSGVRSPFTSGIRSQNVIFRPINEIDPAVFKKPFMIDPDASVFHNEPSIIVDYSHKGSSHGHDSNKVSLAAPYVFVGGAYSPNPASKFAVNYRPPTNPNSLASIGIAPPDPADSGNVRLSPGFLPPHLAKLQKHREEIRTAPTPEPVQLKLAPRRNLEVIGVERKNLPLRNQANTFGEGTIHTFLPNSVSQTLRKGKQRRNILQNSNIGHSEQKPNGQEAVLNNSEVESPSLNIEFSSKESEKIEAKPGIRNG
ncbi:Insect cuticle protein [Trinorchestia longiramus]|nr:Insect cuticle protein [Trinorchestia longiramus]